MNFEEKTIKKEEIFKGRVLNLEVHEVALPDGSTSTRELLFHNGAVSVLAMTNEGEILFVEQYRKAIENLSLEIPAGKLDEGEDRLTCAQRELMEETGYKAPKENFYKICDTHVALGYSSELISIYFVEGLTKDMLVDISLDEDEFLNLKKYRVEEAFELLDKNVITDSKSIIALSWLRSKLLKESK